MVLPLVALETEMDCWLFKSLHGAQTTPHLSIKEKKPIPGSVSDGGISALLFDLLT